jgi:hypothetical protein
MRIIIARFDLTVLTLHLKQYHPNEMNKAMKEDDDIGYGSIYEVANYSNFNNDSA